MTTTQPPLSVRRIAVTRTVLVVVGGLACALFAVVSPYFLSGNNLVNLLNDLAFTGILALPAIFLMMTGFWFVAQPSTMNSIALL